ncbi:MAG: HD domain-containing protein [Myxococcales bacterium]|nr:HD domain-containing protein [Myxococcales bacterium]
MELELLDLLTDLRGVMQDPRYHPERDALYHSLQTFQLAHRATDDRQLWATALLHDVGKAFAPREHERAGARALEGLVAPRVVWLVEHHLDLLRHPRRTRRRYRGDPRLRDLELLRRWDLGGRDPRARVLSPRAAIAILMRDPHSLQAERLTVETDAREGQR